MQAWWIVTIVIVAVVVLFAVGLWWYLKQRTVRLAAERFVRLAVAGEDLADDSIKESILNLNASRAWTRYALSYLEQEKAKRRGASVRDSSPDKRVEQERLVEFYDGVRNDLEGAPRSDSFKKDFAQGFNDMTREILRNRGRQFPKDYYERKADSDSVLKNQTDAYSKGSKAAVQRAFKSR
jgi:hypothetical protein